MSIYFAVFPFPFLKAFEYMFIYPFLYSNISARGIYQKHEYSVRWHYHQYTRPNSKLPSSKHLISGHKWPCAGGKFIYRPAPDWLRRRRTTAIAQSERAYKGGASLTGRSSCFFLSRTVLTKLLRWRKLRISKS